MLVRRRMQHPHHFTSSQGIPRHCGDLPIGGHPASGNLLDSRRDVPVKGVAHLFDYFGLTLNQLIATNPANSVYTSVKTHNGKSQ